MKDNQMPISFAILVCEQLRPGLPCELNRERTTASLVVFFYRNLVHAASHLTRVQAASWLKQTKDLLLLS